MSNNKIEAHKITKPIQLLAAWLVGLAIINVTFLTAAASITQPSWVTGLLSIAAVINVPVFVMSIFLLQTKFRPEMQEDSYYSDYLNNRQGSFLIKEPSKSSDDIKASIETLSKKITELAESKPVDLGERVKELISDEKIIELSYKHSDSRTLSELYIRPEEWENVIEKWADSSGFKRDMDKLISDDLVVVDSENLSAARLTDLGVSVAEHCDNENMLFAQKKSNFFYGSGKSNKRKHAD